MLVKEIRKGGYNGGRVGSEDWERVSAGLHQWGTQDRVSEWGVGCTGVWRSELMLRGCNNTSGTFIWAVWHCNSERSGVRQPLH